MYVILVFLFAKFVSGIQWEVRFAHMQIVDGVGSLF
jgi:hypothetical protein